MSHDKNQLYQSKWSLLFWVMCMGLLLGSCEEEVKEFSAIDSGYDFYPIEVGKSRIYDVEEINYDILFDTAYYQLRETIYDSIVSEDQTTYLIQRDKRDTNGDTWAIDSVWTVSKTENYLAVNENNVIYTKLTFPIMDGRAWDGNSLNARSELTYYFQSLSTSLVDSIGAEDHIRLVIEDIPVNIVSQDERSEVYIKGIGLYSKNYITLKFCNTDDCEIGEITSGRYLQQTLIAIE